MSELEKTEQKRIKEITISNKKTFTSAKKENLNKINVIPIKIAFTPKINHSLTKRFNATLSNKLYQKVELEEENKKNIIKNKKLTMTPRVENHFSNNTSLLSTPNVVIKNFNYNNVYNINIDKEKNKMSFNKIYHNYTYNKPKTTSNINLKSDLSINFNNNKNIINYNNTKEKEKKFYYSRFNSEKNLFTSRINANNNKNVINSGINDFSSRTKNNIKISFYNIQKNDDYNKNIYNSNVKRTSSSMTIRTSEINRNNNYYLPFNINELNIIFEKLNSIIISVKENKTINININCKSFFDFYKESSLKQLFPSFFKESYKLILNSAINLCLFSLIVIYKLSLDNMMSYNIINITERILLFCKINLASFIKQIQIKYKINLGNIFQKYLISQNIINITKEQDLVNIIYQNCKAMTSDIKLIIDYFKTINTMFYNSIIEKFNNISILKEEDYINYFFNNISKNSNNMNNRLNITSRNKYIKRSKINSQLNVLSPIRKNAFENISIKKDNIINNKLIVKKLVKRQKQEIVLKKIDIPYIKAPLMKKYTLILDLDKTLCYYNNKTNEIILRNGIFSFLSSLKPFYEIISFSLESKNVNDYIINMIEQDKKYFEYKFCKEHSILYENILVKDISLIGRDISKIIIVDDDENCFKLNKENGIKIAPFLGLNNNDNKLFELKNILKDIYIKNYEDIRLALIDYRFDIINKITLD